METALVTCNKQLKCQKNLKNETCLYVYKGGPGFLQNDCQRQLSAKWQFIFNNQKNYLCETSIIDFISGIDILILNGTIPKRFKPEETTKILKGPYRVETRIKYDIEGFCDVNFIQIQPADFYYLNGVMLSFDELQQQQIEYCAFEFKKRLIELSHEKSTCLSKTMPKLINKFVLMNKTIKHRKLWASGVDRIIGIYNLTYKKKTISKILIDNSNKRIVCYSISLGLISLLKQKKYLLQFVNPIIELGKSDGVGFDEYIDIWIKELLNEKIILSNPIRGTN